jgi:hypothetical protein
MRGFIGFVLLAFSLYTGWIAWEYGYTSVFEMAFREQPTTQAVVDLWIACGLLFFIMILDNRRNGRSLREVAPFAIVTVLAGSIGPLLYFFFYPDLLQANKARRT